MPTLSVLGLGGVRRPGRHDVSEMCEWESGVKVEYELVTSSSCSRLHIYLGDKGLCFSDCAYAARNLESQWQAYDRFPEVSQRIIREDRKEENPFNPFIGIPVFCTCENELCSDRGAALTHNVVRGQSTLSDPQAAK